MAPSISAEPYYAVPHPQRPIRRRRLSMAPPACRAQTAWKHQLTPAFHERRPLLDMSNASIDLMVLRPGCPAPSDGSAWLSDSSSAGGTSPSASTSTSASAVASASPVREDGQAAKKRRRAPTPPAYPAAVLALPTDGSRLRAANGAPLSATHELRLLRSQVAAMDDELRTLKAQWEAAQPDPRTLMAAHRAAVEKRASVLTDQAHDELADAMAQQQLAFATLQSLVLNAPLYSRGRELFDALHFDTALGLEETDRIGQLRAHFERSMTSIPAAVAHFTKLELDGRADAGQTNTPQNKVSVTGCADHTLVTSVFVSEIPCPSLEQVFNGVLAYFNGLPTAVKRHLGTAMERRRILLNDMETLARTGRQMALDEELGLRIDDYMQYRRTTITSSVLESTANTLVCASLRDHRGIFHVDAITDDAQHPFSARETPRWAMAGLTLEPNEARLAVTLRLAIVYRYERLPQDPAVAQEMREHRAILNGDLLMAAVCQHLREATS